MRNIPSPFIEDTDLQNLLLLWPLLSISLKTTYFTYIFAGGDG